MNEPDNNTAVVDRFEGTWVRTDETPGRDGNWWPICDGPGFEPRAWDIVGFSRTWEDMAEYAPFLPAGPDRTARALALVRAEYAR
jgi:hypothetical protein